MHTVAAMHAWVFRNLDQLRQIYDLEERSIASSRPEEAVDPIRMAPGTAQRLPDDEDVAIAPMPRRPAPDA